MKSSFVVVRRRSLLCSTGPFTSPVTDSVYRRFFERFWGRSFKILVIAAVMAVPLKGWAKVEYDSSQLMMMNAEQISDLVRKKIKKAQDIQAKQDPGDEVLAEPVAVEALKDALRIVLARPDQDGERANAFARIRRELIDLDILEKTLGDITTEAIVNIKSESTNASRVTTYVVMLENLMSELKPEIGENAELKKLIIQIRDAKIKITDSVKNTQLMRSMTKLVSPSETAEKIVPTTKN